MVLTGSAPETDSLEIAQVAQTIKTIDLAEDDAEDVDFVVPDEDLEVRKLHKMTSFPLILLFSLLMNLPLMNPPTKKGKTRARKHPSKLSRKTSASKSSTASSKN